mmetsp:Transcript_3523/g.7025  ORF Transcript_3523/g.7025 Transcript_3523/m.7025 type:complete len:632 (+) Transcript_3523:36-1931(+)
MQSLAVGDIAHSLGIKKTKVGGGDKNVAYLVEGNTLTYGLWIIAAVLGCFAIGFFLRNFELSIKNRNYTSVLEEADELEEMALERVMEIGLTLEDFLRREALEEDLVDTLELGMLKDKRAILTYLKGKMPAADVIKAEGYINSLLTPIVNFVEDRKREAVEAKMVLGEVNQMLGQDHLIPEAPHDDSAFRAKEHEWEMENLRQEELRKSLQEANTVEKRQKPAERLGKMGLTHGRDLESRIKKFFDGVKSIDEVSFPEGFRERFEAFKRTLGSDSVDPETMGASGRKRWDRLAALLKKDGIIDVDARTYGDEKLRERLLYEMYHEVDAILQVKKSKKVLDTLYAGYKAGNLAGGELMRILHSQKSLHEAFDWLFGNSENANILETKKTPKTKAKNSRTARKITAPTEEDLSAPSATGFHHSVDKGLRQQRREGAAKSAAAAAAAASSSSRFEDTRGSAKKYERSTGGAGGAAAGARARDGASAGRWGDEGEASTRARRAKSRIDEDYDRAAVPRDGYRSREASRPARTRSRDSAGATGGYRDSGRASRNEASKDRASAPRRARRNPEDALDDFLDGASQMDTMYDKKPSGRAPPASAASRDAGSSSSRRRSRAEPAADAYDYYGDDDRYYN